MGSLPSIATVGSLLLAAENKITGIDDRDRICGGHNRGLASMAECGISLMLLDIRAECGISLMLLDIRAECGISLILTSGLNVEYH